MVFVTIWNCNGDNQHSRSGCKTNKQLKCGNSTRFSWSNLATKQAIAPAIAKIYSHWKGNKCTETQKYWTNRSLRKRNMQQYWSVLLYPSGNVSWENQKKAPIQSSEPERRWKSIHSDHSLSNCQTRENGITNLTRWATQQANGSTIWRELESAIRRFSQVNKLRRTFLWCKKNQEILINYCPIAHATINLKGHRRIKIDCRRSLARRSLQEGGVP